MRRTHAAKTRIHDRIVELASLRFQQLGLNGVSVSALMKEAGRTVGGFYKHFESRDKLVEEALSRAFGKRNEAFTRFAERKSRSSVSDLLDNYLSQAHAD
jgi:TetR/AcrR family transcriptional repressor of nem operon